MDTKNDLVVYLSEAAIKKFRTIGIDYAVSFTTQCISNLEGFAEEMLVHDHEEADTLILLHAADVLQGTPSRNCTSIHLTQMSFFSLYTCTQTFVRMWYSRLVTMKTQETFLSGTLYIVVQERRCIIFHYLHSLSGQPRPQLFIFSQI